MLYPGTIPMTPEERDLLDELVLKGAVVVSLSRRDPGETGPVVVTTDDGEVELGE